AREGPLFHDGLRGGRRLRRGRTLGARADGCKRGERTGDRRGKDLLGHFHFDLLEGFGTINGDRGRPCRRCWRPDCARRDPWWTSAGVPVPPCRDIARATGWRERRRRGRISM